MNVYIIIGAGVVILVALFLFLNKNKSNTEEKKRPTNNAASVKKPAREEVQREVPKQRVKKAPQIALPQCNFSPFDHSRLFDMGLEKEEVSEFIQELIPQIASQIPRIEKALVNSNFVELESLTHAIKGSSTTVGTGGVADLLSEFNTYLKEGTEKEVILTYIKYLKHYHAQLVKQYS